MNENMYYIIQRSVLWKNEAEEDVEGERLGCFA